MSYTPDSYTASGGQTDFTITFDYLREAHITVTINAFPTTAFTIVSGGTVVRLDSGATVSDAVVISRVTPVDERLVDFIDGAGLTERDLDESFDQLFYALEEYTYLTGLSGLAAAISDAQDAADAAAASEAAADASATAADASADAASASATAADASADAAAADAAVLAAYPQPSFGSNQNKAVGTTNNGALVAFRRAATSSITDGTHIQGLVFEAFESSQQTINSGGNQLFTLAHGMALAPAIVQGWLVCTDAGGDNGYAQNARINVSSVVRVGGNNGFTIQVDTTNIKVYLLNDSTPLAAVDTSKAMQVLDETKWKLVVTAWTWQV